MYHWSIPRFYQHEQQQELLVTVNCNNHATPTLLKRLTTKLADYISSNWIFRGQHIYGHGEHPYYLWNTKPACFVAYVKIRSCTEVPANCWRSSMPAMHRNVLTVQRHCWKDDAPPSNMNASIDCTHNWALKSISKHLIVHFTINLELPSPQVLRNRASTPKL